MPKHTPKPSFVRFRPNPAAAALGVGIAPDRWTPDGMIHAMINRYLQLVKLAEDEKDQGNTRKQRLYQSGALELAQVIASYYQDRGDSETFARWDRRVKMAQSVAYRTTNPNAVAAGVETPADPEE